MQKHIIPQFRHPFTMCVAGSTGSGKTEWIMKFLKHSYKLIDPQIHSILYCYGEMNEKIARLPSMIKTPVQTFSGVPEEQFIKEAAERTHGRLLVILDDLIVGIRSQFLDVLYTRGSHNWGASVVLVTQHLFSKEIRTARVNSHYLVLLNSPCAALQVKNLATQLFANQVGFFTETYSDATRAHFGYLIIDLHPKTDEDERLKTNIYPEEWPTVYYVPKNRTNQ